MASTTEVRLAESTEGGRYTGSFTLTAVGGPVTFSVTSPVSASEPSVAPLTGSLATGKTVTVTLSAPAQGGPPTDLTTLTVDPGGLTVQVFYPPSS